MKILVGETSAVYRSIFKEIIGLTEKLSLCDSVVSESDLFEKIKSVHPDCLSVDSTLFIGKKIDQILYELGKTKLPTILFVSKKHTSVYPPKNVAVIVKPNFESFSTEKMKENALGLESIFFRLKKELFDSSYSSSVSLMNHKSNELCSQNISAPSKFLTSASQNKKDVMFFSEKRYCALCIGVSTGGPSTIMELLNGIGCNFPLPIFITQHIDDTFDKSLIDWLQKNVPLPIHLAKDGDVPQNGHAYFAPSDVHLTFGVSEDNKILLKLNHDAPVNFLRPAVDKMFESAANVFGSKCIGVLLTGMGNDGAQGCCKIKKKGGYTIAQDEKSCIVFGMPKAAIDCGGVNSVLPLPQIANFLKKLVGEC